MVLFRKYVWEVTGWVGALFALLAFSLNSFNVIGSQSILYLGMYIVGCLLMALYALSKKAHASWVVNAIFLLVALIALVKVHIIS